MGEQHVYTGSYGSETYIHMYVYIEIPLHILAMYILLSLVAVLLFCQRLIVTLG